MLSTKSNPNAVALATPTARLVANYESVSAQSWPVVLLRSTPTNLSHLFADQFRYARPIHRP